LGSLENEAEGLYRGLQKALGRQESQEDEAAGPDSRASAAMAAPDLDVLDELRGLLLKRTEEPPLPPSPANDSASEEPAAPADLEIATPSRTSGTEEAAPFAVLNLRQDETPIPDVDRAEVAEATRLVIADVHAEQPASMFSRTASARAKVYPASRTGLPDLRQVASDLTANKYADNWETFFWALVASDDVPGAYWLSRSAEACGQTPFAPTWLLAALHGASLAGLGDPVAYELQDFATLPETDKADPLLRMAAALYVSLIAPESGMALWLGQTGFRSFDLLVEAVVRFASSGMPLRFGAMPSVAPLRRESFEQLSEDARQYLETEAPKRSFGMNGAWAVWQEFIGPTGGVRQMLMPVISNRTDGMQSVKKQLSVWQDIGRTTQKINQTFAAWSHGRDSRIEGGPRNRLLREIKTAVEFARKWCSLVDYSKTLKSEDSQDAARTAELVNVVTELLPEVEDELRRIRVPDVSLRDAAAAHCLERTLEQLCHSLKLKTTLRPPKPRPDFYGRRDLETKSLPYSLARRLWWLPEVSIEEDGSPKNESLQQIGPALLSSVIEDRTLLQAFEEWTNRAVDFRSARRILKELKNTSDDPILNANYEDRLQRNRDKLARAKSDASDAIERAVLDGIVDDRDTRSERLSQIESIDTGQILEFGTPLGRINAIQDELRGARAERLKHLQEEWEKLKMEATETGFFPGPEEISEQVATLCSFIDTAIARGDTRVLDECVAGMAEILHTGGKLKDKLERLAWFAPASGHDELNEFLKRSQQLSIWIEAHPENLSSLPDKLKADSKALQPFGINFPKIERRNEVIDAIEAWLRLRQNKDYDAESRDISRVLTYLGFQPLHGMEIKVTTPKRGGNWMLAHVEASPGNAARPIRQYGSEAQGKYPVLCLWGRPESEPIISRMNQIGTPGDPFLVFYFGHRSKNDREQLAKIARDKGCLMAVLDDNLLLFLAGHTEQRLRSFFRCTLPFAAVNPYTPKLRGRVPEEMFVGRENLIREIMDPQGSCIIFGGRQLGKTAIERHVEKLYNRPDLKQHVWWISMHEVFQREEGGGTDNIWQSLRQKFKSAGMSTAGLSSKDAIIEHVLANPELQILAMFDEADDFLEADSRAGFRETHRIRDVMDRTNRRFKLIFAGNYKVQRFQDIPDHPLAHYGTELMIGPLAPAEARELVRRPLDAIGYRFDDDATVLRILSYTNYHALLIHVFCDALIRRMHKERDQKYPHTITREHVEAVYGDTDVRRGIRELFDLTLGLEVGYQAITVAMIKDQIQNRDSYSRAYPASDILVQLREIWPEVYGGATLEQIRIRLDEMRGLGVLVENTEGAFWLRSPNMVRMLGTEEMIAGQIEKIRTRARQPQSDLEINHACLHPEERRFSPLTYAQERFLNKSRTGLGIIFGSEALGFNDLVETFNHFLPEDNADNGTGRLAEIPDSVKTGADLTLALQKLSGTQSHYQKQVLYQFVNSQGEIEQCVNTALEFCKTRRSDGRVTRLILIFGPAAIWKWLALPSPLRDRLEAEADACVCVRPWTQAGIARRLELQSMAAPAYTCELVYETTGGWPLLLDELFKLCTTADPVEAAHLIQEGLLIKDSPLVLKFRAALGVDTSPVALEILNLLSQHDQLEKGFFSPEFLSTQCTLEESNAALDFLAKTSCVQFQQDQVKCDPLVAKLFGGKRAVGTAYEPNST
jgi:hypothetical protein